MHGKDFVTPSDVALASTSVLRHRLILSYEAEAQGITTDTIISNVLGEVQVP
jgi:MoxR-like ATPase